MAGEHSEEKEDLKTTDSCDNGRIFFWMEDGFAGDLEDAISIGKQLIYRVELWMEHRRNADILRF